MLNKVRPVIEQPASLPPGLLLVDMSKGRWATFTRDNLGHIDSIETFERLHEACIASVGGFGRHVARLAQQDPAEPGVICFDEWMY